MERFRERLPYDLRPIGIVALACAAVWSTSIAAGTWKSVRVKPEQRTIRVTGSAKKRIVSDLADWEATLEARASDRTAAYKQLHEQTDKAIELLKSEGIKPDEIRPQSATFEEEDDTITDTKVV
ncbi:MAG TPA: SIMPL domain-containing protein, partial [Kofleriaceae bacterium]|nr:SIMPL domain-containing protein [Kofleriaceae bacterium]